MLVKPDFKKTAMEAAEEAGRILNKYFVKSLKVSLKKDFSLVTSADFEAEKAILRLIKRNFPEHDILSEESGGKIGNGYTWLVDPLDGTTNYTAKIPFFSCSVALTYRGRSILAVILNPTNGELYFAEKGKGTFLNGRRIKTGDQKKLANITILLDKGRAKTDFIRFHKIMGRVGRQCRSVRCLGSLSLGLCHVASGRIGGLIDTGSSPWDYAAGILVVKEAGGKATDFQGKEWKIETKNIVVANRIIHRQLLNLVR